LAEEEKKERKKKPLWEDDVKCSWCGKSSHVKVERKVLVPAEPAEVEIVVTVEKCKQTKLEDIQ